MKKKNKKEVLIPRWVAIALEVLFWMAVVVIAFWAMVCVTDFASAERGYAAMGSEIFVPLAIIGVAYAVMYALARPLWASVRRKEELEEETTAQIKPLDAEAPCVQAIACINEDGEVVVQGREKNMDGSWNTFGDFIAAYATGKM